MIGLACCVALAPACDAEQTEKLVDQQPEADHQSLKRNVPDGDEYDDTGAGHDAYGVAPSAVAVEAYGVAPSAAAAYAPSAVAVEGYAAPSAAAANVEVPVAYGNVAPAPVAYGPAPYPA